jgi:hypothetical protein
MKRKTDHIDLDSSAASEVVRVLTVCRGWRDRCGRAFKLMHRIERFTDKAVVTVASFDRVTCPELLVVCKSQKAGAHRITEFTTSASERSVSFFITRAPATAEKEDGKNMADELALEQEGGGVVTFVPPGAVRTADEGACRVAARALHAACGKRGDIFVRVLPSNYELVLGGVRSVTAKSCRLLRSWPSSFIDFENASAVVIVDRLMPDL